MDPRTNMAMVRKMREPRLLAEQIMRNDAYAARHIRFIAPIAAYTLLSVTNHPLITDGPGDDTFAVPGRGMLFSYTPVAVLLAISGFTVEVIETHPSGSHSLGTVKVLPQSTVVNDGGDEFTNIEDYLE
jgi:hypothetical protein